MNSFRMPRSKHVLKKRKHVGKPSDIGTGIVSNDTVVSECAILDDSYLRYNEYDENSDFGYEIISLNFLQNVLDTFAACKNYNGIIYVQLKRRIGLASDLQVFCKNCENSFGFFNSDKFEKNLIQK